MSFRFCFPLAICLRCQKRVTDARSGPGMELIGEKKRRRMTIRTLIVITNVET